MKTVKRWHRNIKWLLNRPPTFFTEAKEPFLCSYCGELGWIRFDGIEYAFCEKCLKKAMDKALKGVGKDD